MANHQTFLELIERELKYMNLTTDKLAEKSGISKHTTEERYLADNGSVPKLLRIIRRIAGVLEMDEKKFRELIESADFKWIDIPDSTYRIDANFDHYPRNMREAARKLSVSDLVIDVKEAEFAEKIWRLFYGFHKILDECKSLHNELHRVFTALETFSLDLEGLTREKNVDLEKLYDLPTKWSSVQKRLDDLKEWAEGEKKHYIGKSYSVVKGSKSLFGKDWAEATYKLEEAISQHLNSIDPEFAIEGDERFPYRAALFNLLRDLFGQEELKDLCFKLRIDYEELSDNRKSSLIRELILHFERRRRIPTLLEAIREEHPDIDFYIPGSIPTDASESFTVAEEIYYLNFLKELSTLISDLKHNITEQMVKADEELRKVAGELIDWSQDIIEVADGDDDR